MSSSEVLFILAFIVLPTAVLVSSVWAVLFVRRRPDRVVEYAQPDETRDEDTVSERFDVVVDTAVLPTVASPMPEPEPDDALPDDDRLLDESDVEEEETFDTVNEPADLTLHTVDEDVAPDTAHVDSYDDVSDALQTTDDLNEVVARVTVIEQDQLSSEAIEEAEATETAEVEDETPEIYETSDLPVLEPRSQPQPAIRPAQDDPREMDGDELNAMPAQADDVDRENESQSRWRRRKRPSPLRASDAEANRGRSRSRDPQRQVPQLGRSSRRRDGDSRGVAPDDTTDEPR